MFKKGRFLVTGLTIMVFLFLQATPVSAYDVARTFGPIDIHGAKITIQFINNWSDEVIKEAINLRKSGQIDAVAWTLAGYISKFCGKDVMHYGACQYLNLKTTQIDGSTQYVFLMYRQTPTEFLKQPIQLLPQIILIDLVGDLRFAGVIDGMGFFSPASYNDTSGWADNVITTLTQKGILVATSGGDVEKRLFRPDSTAKRLDAVSWLTLAFPKPIDKTVAEEWQGDKNASDVYRPDLGYSAYLLDRNEMIGNIYGATPIALFGLVDAALKLKVLVPYTDGSLGLDNEVNRADLAYMIAKTMGWSDQPDVALKFWDTREPRWQSYLGVIGACVSKGILKGYPDGSFSPEGTMTRADVAVAIYRLLGLGSAPENPNTVTPTHTTLIQSFQVGTPTMTVNGKPVAMDVAPTVVEDRTLLPARYVAEPLGANVTWSPIDQKVTISSTRPWIRLDKTLSTTTATTVELWIGNPTAKVNGVEVPIDPANPKVTPMILPPGRTMVPLRFIGEALGAQVSWNPDTHEIMIVSSPPQSLQEKTLPPP